mgnify:FL=1
MRPIRTLAVAAIVVSLVATPALALGQSSDPEAKGSLPQALQPDGRLPLEGTPWRLQWYRWKDAERQPGPEVAARMTLRAGELEASGGCTAFKGSYGTVGEAIDFQLKRLKDNDCGEQTTMAQLAMVDGLRDAARFEIGGADGASRLTLFGQAGTELLRFGLDDSGPITHRVTSAEWLLTAYTIDGSRQAPAPNARPNLILSPDTYKAAKRRATGAVLSSTGCNGFTGEFYARGNVMSFGELSITDAPCPEALVPQQEAILAVFDATAVRTSTRPDTLVLASADSDVSLEYRAVPALEDYTWVRSPRLPRDEGDWTTLKLESGRATGEGPCGPYSADYATDGRFITFSDVQGAGSDGCERTKDERKLLAALRNAVLIDRDRARSTAMPRLTLRDARDKVLIRFEYPFGNAP